MRSLLEKILTVKGRTNCECCSAKGSIVGSTALRALTVSYMLKFLCVQLS